ncbi:hypothetical protein B0H14DRAFT_2607840 [Mycena olivaceomarginata]|nr:hypothetical protein B0H14DRAFT_2607840 [Mycena olivaceomarginata]
MDLQPHKEPKLTVTSTTDIIGPAPHAGAFFTGATGFTIGGGHLTSNITNTVFTPPAEPLSAFRTIRLGDINLLRELRLNRQSGGVSRSSSVASVRHMYSAEVHGRDMTVAIYQGNGAEEEWRQNLENYDDAVRHPNVLQLYGLVNTSRLSAMVFHNDLVPYMEFVNRLQHSPFLSTYIRGTCCAEFYVRATVAGTNERSLTYDSQEAWTYIDSVKFTNIPGMIGYHQCTFFVRVRTGQLVIDLSLDPEQEPDFEFIPWKYNFKARKKLECRVVLRSTEDHQFCITHSLAVEARASHWKHGWRTAKMRFSWSPEGELCITRPPALHWNDSEWGYTWETDRVMANGWIRLNSRDAKNLDIEISMHVEINSEAWLTQANHLFNLRQSSTFENYVLVTDVLFNLRCINNNQKTSQFEGYLFLCPEDDFQTGLSSYQWPHRPAYWSLDPSGVDPLTVEDAKNLGFDTIHIETFVDGISWDDTVYHGLRRFYAGKGFDPDSQDLARLLGYPLFEPASGPIVRFPYGEISMQGSSGLS